MRKIIMVCSEGNSSNCIYNKVTEEFEISNVIIVKKEDKKKFIKRRIKRLGVFSVLGQILFIIYSKIILNNKADKRVKEIIGIFSMNTIDIPINKRIYIDSVNSDEMRELLIKFNPDIVLVNGTPIIKKHILNSINAYFVNIHVGITPKYRGVHGGYWALYNNDKNLFGVTTHLVDQGIDSGGILDQKILKSSEKDNFLTYPYLQLGSALLNYNNLLSSIFKDEITLKKPIINDSKIWYHPTLIQYLYGRIFKGVK